MTEQIQKCIQQIKRRELKNVFFEYTLFIIIITSAIIITNGDKYWLSRCYFGLMIILSIRHHELNTDVRVIQVSENKYCMEELTKRRIFTIFTRITIFTSLILFAKTQNMFTLTCTVTVWFIFTDIFRTMYSVNGIYISRWFYIAEINVNNSKWEMHRADRDPFPSVPHMHSLDGKMKLNIYTGEIYDVRNNEVVQVVKNKKLMQLWRSKNFLNNVHSARSVYKDNNPHYILEDIPEYLVKTNF